MRFSTLPNLCYRRHWVEYFNRLLWASVSWNWRFHGGGWVRDIQVHDSFPDVNVFFHVILAGLVTAFVGVLFGLPSLRIKGFYLAVATLAAQFF